MTFSEELIWRGLVGQTTIDDLSELDKGGRTFYLGADPSADSMTIGNLAALITCLRFIKAGHHGVLLAGAATSLAGGDPDGKDETRDQIDANTIERRVAIFKQQYHKIFRTVDIDIVNNYDWFSQINYIDFLRLIGWHFSMTQLLDRDFVKRRIGEGGKGINYAEFSYSLIQGYDFLHLYRTKGVTLQICGVDQYGNATSGLRLISKLANGRGDVFGIPLVVNKSTGKKFGKSEAGAIWLDDQKTSVYQFYQFWLNCDDAGVVDYLKVYTFLTPDEITDIANRHQAHPEKRLAQQKLAQSVTAFVHGEEAADNATKVTEVLFGGLDVLELTSEQIELLGREIPVAAVGQSITDILLSAKVADSKSEARRLIAGNSISIDNQKITDDITVSKMSILKKGKNQFILIK